ncbi:hypothetical protein HW555_013603 [Spodoptera exigua]|uniref:DUF5641 domain-containing protein n=1 Tax=Spodoptera exigua TaxID=7107 RepID=A0A835G3U3_SPOEX|nr:hypothetical protein HW555_013603 [Spodoptera exigua]
MLFTSQKMRLSTRDGVHSPSTSIAVLCKLLGNRSGETRIGSTIPTRKLRYYGTQRSAVVLLVPVGVSGCGAGGGVPRISLRRVKDNHKLANCKRFAGLDIEKRRNFVQTNGLCYNCLGANHSVYACRQSSRCHVCKRKHHSLLHLKNVSKSGGDSNNPDQVVESSGSAVTTSNQSIGYDQEKSSISLNSMVLIKVKSRIDPSFIITVKAYVLKKLTTILPERKVMANVLTTISSLALADPSFDTPNKIDLLLDAEVYSQILLEGLFKGSSSQLIAQNTRLGWILSGQVGTTLEERKIKTKCHATAVEFDDSLLTRFSKFSRLVRVIAYCRRFLRMKELECNRIKITTWLTTKELNEARWHLTQKMLQNFWRRWSLEYLTQLQHRYKWTNCKPEPEIGDVVLVKEDGLPPARWLYGIVTNKHPGLDNITRVVTIRCKNSEIKRPLSKLIMLPVTT